MKQSEVLELLIKNGIPALWIEYAGMQGSQYSHCIQFVRHVNIKNEREFLVAFSRDLTEKESNLLVRLCGDIEMEDYCTGGDQEKRNSQFVFSGKMDDSKKSFRWVSGVLYYGKNPFSGPADGMLITSDIIEQRLPEGGYTLGGGLITLFGRLNRPTAEET